MDIQSIIQMIYRQAQLLGACDLFKGTEDLAGLVKLFKSPQGIEFCLKNNFPNLATLRLFKPLDVEQFEIYIDAGTIQLINPTNAILVGRTIANINCDTNKAHRITLMQGAKATLTARQWAVAFVKEGRGTSCIKCVYDNAIIE